MKYDLHIHSTFSDGSLTPKQIVDQAKERGLAGIAITDHDVVGAYNESADYAASLGLEMITGSEFSCEYKDITVHVLGYSFEADDRLIKNLCTRHSHRRFARNSAILELLMRNGMPLTMEEVIEIGGLKPAQAIGRPHIALSMVAKGYVADLPTAFRDFIGKGKPCYHAGKGISIGDTLDIIHAAKGLAFLAHPHLVEGGTKYIEGLLKLPFDGLECYYARFDASKNARWIKAAKKRQWYISGGSDFHGDIKPASYLGSSYVEREHFAPLWERFCDNNRAK